VLGHLVPLPVTEVGAATASNSYVGHIGASLGSAVVGHLFVNRLIQFIADSSAESTPAVGGTRSHPTSFATCRRRT
jgi:hypothetical protein